jgi:hypothetical protein
LDNLQQYAPITLYIITTLLGLKIFARRDELTSLETKIITYINASFVSKESYQDLKDQIKDVKTDVREIKNLIIQGYKK